MVHTSFVTAISFGSIIIRVPLSGFLFPTSATMVCLPLFVQCLLIPSVYCSVLLIALFSSTCYWGANEPTICEESSKSSISPNITSPLPSSTLLLNPVLNMLIGSGKYSYQYSGHVPEKEAPTPCHSGIKGHCWLYFGRSRTIQETITDKAMPNHSPAPADKVDTSTQKGSFLWSPFKAKRKHDEL